MAPQQRVIKKRRVAVRVPNRILIIIMIKKDNYQGLCALINNPLPLRSQLEHGRHDSREHIRRFSPAVSAESHQGSHFLSTTAAVLAVPTSSTPPHCAVSASHTVPVSAAEASRLEGQSSSSNTEGSTLSRCRKVISAARRFPRLLLTRCVAPAGGDGGGSR